VDTQSTVKTKKLSHIRVRTTVKRIAAEWLLEAIKGNTDFDETVEDLEYQLRSFYTYKVKCIGCSTMVTYVSDEKLSNKEADKKYSENSLCDRCFDLEDFK
jgi:hypothetical protein